MGMGVLLIVHAVDSFPFSCFKLGCAALRLALVSHKSNHAITLNLRWLLIDSLTTGQSWMESKCIDG